MMISISTKRLFLAGVITSAVFCIYFVVTIDVFDTNPHSEVTGVSVITLTEDKGNKQTCLELIRTYNVDPNWSMVDFHIQKRYRHATCYNVKASAVGDQKDTLQFLKASQKTKACLYVYWDMSDSSGDFVCLVPYKIHKECTSTFVFCLIMKRKPHQASSSSSASLSFVRKVCPISTGVLECLQRPWIQYKDILLLIIFTNPIYKVIPYVQAIHGNIFRHILYCVPSKIDKYYIRTYDISFIIYKNYKTNADLQYTCMGKAIDKVKYSKLAGIFLVNDDVYIHSKLAFLRPMSTPWYVTIPNGPYRYNVLLNGKTRPASLEKPWLYWYVKSRHGFKIVRKKAALYLSSYMQQTAKALRVLTKKASNSLTLNRCKQNLNCNKMSCNVICLGGSADILYLPRRLWSSYQEVESVFKASNVHAEIATPTMLQCLTNFQFSTMKGIFNWTYPRKMLKPWDHTQELDELEYFHPVKLGAAADGDKKFNEYFCTELLPRVHCI